ncbi:MAG: tetratricopeptide repeat protein [Candidatus Korobacteraceae bacterium]
MTRFCPMLLVLVLATAGGFAQSGQTSDGESTSRPQPDAPASPPDAPIPDQGTQTTPPAKSAAKRTINKLDPHCIDAIFHTCWSSPAATSQKPMSDDEQQAAKDIEVGYYYLRDKNYLAAESRLKEAVEIKPNSPEALIGLAQAQQKLGKRNDARQNYETYLKLKPNGPDAEKVKTALAQLK